MSDFDPARSVSVEEILAGKRCSPLTLSEFEGFLIHEEHSEENLLFVVWYRDYRSRFSALSPALQALSPPPAERYRPFAAGSIRAPSTRSPSVMEKDRSWWDKVMTASKGSRKSLVDLEKNSGEGGWFDAKGGDRSETSSRFGADDETVSFRTAADPESAAARREESAFTNPTFPSISVVPTDAPAKLRFAGLVPTLSRRDNPLPADTPLPFVDEISLILTTFILPGAARELNLDARLKKFILLSLRPIDEAGNALPPATTHPDVLSEVHDHALDLLERFFPSYLNWAKGNINARKSLFWYGVGLTDILIGVMIALLILFYVHTRWWRLFSFLFIQFGTMQFYSASRYFCSQVHGRTSRQLYPWELTSELTTEEHERPTTSPFSILNEKHSHNVPSSPRSTESSNGSATVVEPASNKIQKPKGRWFGSWKRADGGEVPIFGPERVVEDEYIRYLHNQQIKEILFVGAIVTLLFEIAIVAIPERVL